MRATPRLLPRRADRPQLERWTGAVTVYVPARDEAEVIERCVRALGAEEAYVAEIVVVDDGSTDGTTDILARLASELPRLHVLRGVGPKRGECGKPAALVHAGRERPASTEWLLFIDADVVLAPGAVGALLAAAEAHGADLVSVVPDMETKSAIEALVLPSVGALVLAANPPAEVASPASRTAFANGQVIFIRRPVYEAAGGHAAVVSEVLEDVRLAERVKARGHRLLIADGRHLAATRMYSGWAELVEGWSKNLYLLVGGTLRSALGWALVVVALAWVGPILAMFAGVVGIAAWVAIGVMQAILRARGGAEAKWAVFAPISALLTAFILLRSARLHRGRAQIAWKGRRYTSVS